MAKETKITTGNFDAVMQQYTGFMKDTLAISYDADLLRTIAEGLGTAIYHPDASLVACSDTVELAHVKDNFLIGTLKLTESPKLMEAIKKVCTRMGSSNRRKYRTVFYYLLIEELGMEKEFPKTTQTTEVKTAPKTKPVATAKPAVETVPKQVKKTAPVVEQVKKTSPVVEQVKETIPITEHVEHTALVAEHTIDQHLLTLIAHSVGVNDHTDSSHVDLHNAEERERIKHHFLVGKLGLEHTGHLDHALNHVATQFPETKNRAEVYYHLVKHFGKEDAITTPTNANLY